ncbi:hypothetical protein ACOSQ3_024816 [Xanthoceras sorbifolium]
MCGMSFTDFRFSWKDERKTKGRLAADERKRTKAAATVLARCRCRRGRVEDDEGCGDRVEHFRRSKAMEVFKNRSNKE